MKHIIRRNDPRNKEVEYQYNHRVLEDLGYAPELATALLSDWALAGPIFRDRAMFWRNGPIEGRLNASRSGGAR